MHVCVSKLLDWIPGETLPMQSEPISCQVGQDRRWGFSWPVVSVPDDAWPACLLLARSDLN